MIRATTPPPRRLRRWVPRPMPGGHRRRIGVALVAVLASLALTGCRLDVDTNVEVTAAGAGTLSVVLDLDRELLDALTATGFDPTPEVVEGWGVERTATEDGDRIEVRTTFDSPDELSARVTELADGLGDDDPRLVESIDLQLSGDGRTTMSARIGLRLPSSIGVEGPGFADADDLADVVDDPASFGATFTVTLPGPIEEHNADEVRDRTAVWVLVPGEDLVAQASAGPPELLGGWVLTAIGLGVLAALIALGTWLLRRRRREQQDAPLGRVTRL